MIDLANREFQATIQKRKKIQIINNTITEKEQQKKLRSNSLEETDTNLSFDSFSVSLFSFTVLLATNGQNNISYTHTKAKKKNQRGSAPETAEASRVFTNFSMLMYVKYL